MDLGGCGSRGQFARGLAKHLLELRATIVDVVSVDGLQDLG